MSCYREAFPQSSLLLPGDRVPVFYAHISIVDAILSCYRVLTEEAKEWKLVISGASTELPSQGINHIRLEK